ncbi:D-alanyl-D-alanine carboxypeptidase (penicillin-binding protein 5/6) [Alkalicoccobacillus murimartini]|uniref:serine-type D-Ala-D-Ala carboxypeptidase n=1 Tax=Alkalicoccobacillus murimartini TaxID=171685 RepID=A0ABT9YQM8_9BACI|nr:D-alanyl-D-alanine carboxypeptidase family protein [Alkalicoccobacillus murimartini]MDQ0209324.1 D-alanyl-D-alanine carboxypeptidase (penicillin-binding protein 5/6) [Alkalicoccobacillus murimartini]
MSKPAKQKVLLGMMAASLALSIGLNPQTAKAAIDVEASASILVDADSGKILYADNIDDQLPIASMTKMMSEYLILEAIDQGQISEDDEVEISDHVRSLSLQISLSNVPLRQDYSYTVKELYQSVAIYSANASTIALAEHVAGSEANFVQMMNDKAEELGLESYNFVNSSGLNNSDLSGNHPDGTDADAENELTAKSVAQLAYHLLKDYPEVLDTASIPELEFQAGEEEVIEMQNWNWMIPGVNAQHEYEGADGLKTGFTSAAGNSFTGTAVRDNMRLITVVMGAETRDDRFDETAKLFDYGFDNFHEAELLSEGYKPEGEDVVSVTGGKENEVSLSTSSALTAVIKNDEDELYVPEVNLSEDLLNEDGEFVAPLEEGQEVGEVFLAYNGEVEDQYLYSNQSNSTPLVTEQAVEKAGWFTMSMRGIGSFFSGIWTSVSDTVTGWF